MPKGLENTLSVSLHALCWVLGGIVAYFAVRTAVDQSLNGWVLLGFVVALAAFLAPTATTLEIVGWLKIVRAEREKAEAAADDARHAVNVARVYYWVASATGGTYRDHPDVREDLRNWLLRAADEPVLAEAMKQARAWGDSSAESLRDIADGLGSAGILRRTESKGTPYYEVVPEMKTPVREAFG